MPTKKPTVGHRLTLTEIVEKQIAAMSTNEDCGIVRLTLNARRDTQIEVKVSVRDEGTGGTLEGAAALAGAIYDTLGERYAPQKPTP